MASSSYTSSSSSTKSNQNNNSNYMASNSSNMSYSTSAPNALALQQQQQSLSTFGNLNGTSTTTIDESTLRLDFSPIETINQWKRMLECDEFVGARRSKHTAVAYKEAIYVFGGDNGKNMLNDLIRFDVKDASWGRAFTHGPPPAPRYHHSAVIYESSMFIFGGYTGDIHSNSNLTNKNDLFEYKFQTGQWIEWKFLGRTPVPRSAHGAAVYDNKLWIYAGYDGNARLNDMWIINLSGALKQWEEIEQKGDRPPTCCNFPVAVARGCMYVFSGQSGLQITNTLFEFNFKTLTWRRISNDHILRIQPSPPSRRYGHTMVHNDRFLYVFGGSADSTLPHDLYTYDLDSQLWSVIVPDVDSQIPSGRVFHASAVIADAMYIFGGTVDNNIRSGDMFRFQFSTYPRCTLHDDFGRFLSLRQFCDLCFIVGDNEEECWAHIAMIAARSQYLKAKILDARNRKIHNSQISLNNNNNNNINNENAMLDVYLPNAEPEAFEMVLNYIYTDRINIKDELINNNKIVLLMMDIYQLAEQFDIPRLEQVCLQYLEMKILKSNVLDALYNADKMNLPIIKDYCLQFIVKDENVYDIAMAKEFIDLEKLLIVDVIRKRLENSLISGGVNSSGSGGSGGASSSGGGGVGGNNCGSGSISIQKNTEATKYDKIGNNGTTLENDMAIFLQNGKEFCDINLMLDGHLIPAHKSILSARCSYFQAMFRSFMPSDNIVNIQIGDFIPSIQSFYSLLNYIYYGKTKMPPEDSLYLFQAPSFYGFTNNRLQAYCKHNIEHNIQYENVLNILEASDQMNMPDIKHYALRIIVKHFSKIARMPKLNLLNRDLLLEIITTVSDVVGDINLSHDNVGISISSDI